MSEIINFGFENKKEADCVLSRPVKAHRAG